MTNRPPVVKAIDIHAHVFNLRYLPVAGILDYSGMVDLPIGIARALAFLALAATRTDSTLDRTAAKATLNDSSIRIETAELDRLIEDFDAHIEEAEARIPESAWANPTVQQALREASMMSPAAATTGFRLRTLIAYAKRLIAAAGGVVRAIDWVFAVATARERVIVRRLLDTYGTDVDLFVHHMMDMKNHYPNGTTKYSFSPRQILRMEALGRVSNGRLAAFVAWDPFRDDGLDIVRDAIDNHGCIGVKVYPPSGYRPYGNDQSDRPRRVKTPSPEILDERMLRLFEWCAGGQIPVFTHCTPEGFEAYPNAGANCDPRYWAMLLQKSEKLRTLRLCFGHAGGDGWFAGTDQAWRGSFAGQVAQLCADPRYPNLYCEVGILSDVRDSAARRRFAERVRAFAAANPIFLRRLLYGSDWHMLYMHADHRDFLRDYVRFCEEAGFTRDQEADFFRNNALRYLQLSPARIEKADAPKG
jgi:predicted TIM-barrel fold metal-dependent hydrolase